MTLTSPWPKKIQQEGIICTKHASDEWYDGDLCLPEAPDVVFFQASEFGGDPSIYPRGVVEYTEKRRILVDPNSIGLHTDSYRFYFADICESRERSDGGVRQLNLLFVPRDHKCIPFCDANFLLLNKEIFQPFRYDKSEQHWVGSHFRTTTTFGGRSVKLNVCVAQNVYVPKIPDYKEDLVEAIKSALDGWSMAIPPRESQALCEGAYDGRCKGCTYYHPKTWDKRIPLYCPRCNQEVRGGPDGMQEHRKVCTSPPPLWCEVLCCGCHQFILQGARNMFEHNKVCQVGLARHAPSQPPN
eukprot:PhF_6_TR18739/c0_g1_i1/m.27372